MSGYCPDCGNTVCLCGDDIPPLLCGDDQAYVIVPAEDARICKLLTPSDLGDSPTACDWWERRSLDLEQQIHHLEQEIAYLKQQQWEPSEGVWWVHREEAGRSSTMIAKPDCAERETILRAALQVNWDVAVKAIRESFDRNTFCPVMLEHADHDGSCGVWPSADKIWSAVRDALAKELGGQDAAAT